MTVRGIFWLTAALAAAAPVPESGPRPSAPTVCDCLKRPRCWGLAKAAFVETFGGEKSEVQGALPGRFFPGTRTWALRRTDKSGHFLSVECGPRHAACPEKRDALELRLLASTFLSSVPLHGPASDYFDPNTWEIKAPGVAVLKESRECRPTFWKEIEAAAGLRSESAPTPAEAEPAPSATPSF